MNASDVPVDDLVNKGWILNTPRPIAPARSGSTYIVTGLHRSGTSLVAAILRQVGIFMGTEINDIVHEDEAIARLLIARDQAALRHLIAERNTDYGTWGFKFPMLCQSLDHQDFAMFSDPRVIVTFRDPVSVAVRNALSEYREPMPALRAAVDDMAALVAFVERLECPTLLLSYEKSLLFPNDFIDAIIEFCGLPRGAGLRDGLVRLIEPNRRSYLEQARRRYEGIIEGIDSNSLYGWCRLTGIADPVPLDLLLDGQSRLSFTADGFRQDLLDAGFGVGKHGFSIDLSKLDPRPDQVIRIKVAGHRVELRNSGQRLDAYAVRSPQRLTSGPP